MSIDSEGTTADVIDIASPTTTSGIIFDVNADSLTTGKILDLTSNSADTSTRTLVQITNDNTAATGTTALTIQQDSTASALTVTQTNTGNAVTLENTMADVTSQTWLLTLKYTDDGDTDADYIRGLDNTADVQFQIDSDGSLQILYGSAKVCTAGACPSGFANYVSAGDIGAENDIHAAGGYKNSFNFGKENVPASQTAVAIYVASFSETNTEIVMPYAGSVIAISVASNAARTAGTLTVDATVNGTATGLQAVLDVTNTTYHHAHQDPELDLITAGDRLGVKITTSADWLPTTADIVVTVVIEY